MRNSFLNLKKSSIHSHSQKNLKTTLIHYSNKVNQIHWSDTWKCAPSISCKPYFFALELPQIHPFEFIPTTSHPHCPSKTSKYKVFNEKYRITDHTAVKCEKERYQKFFLLYFPHKLCKCYSWSLNGCKLLQNTLKSSLQICAPSVLIPVGSPQ